jgi:hypothetical protein
VGLESPLRTYELDPARIRAAKSFTGRRPRLDQAKADRPDGRSELAGSTEWRYDSPGCKLA